jgi:hypothetical protein
MIRAVAVTVLAAGCSFGQVRIRTVELGRAIRGVPYRAVIETLVDGRCEHSDPSFAVVAGALPKGLELTSVGLDGSAMEIGLFRFTVRAETPCGGDVRDFQLLVTAKPILRVFPEELQFDCRSGAVAEARSIRVTSTWPVLPYSAHVEGGDWVDVRAEQGSTPDVGSALSADLVLVRVDASKLAAGVYRAVVVLSAWMGANAPEIPVVLTVRGN